MTTSMKSAISFWIGLEEWNEETGDFLSSAVLLGYSKTLTSATFAHLKTCSSAILLLSLRLKESGRWVSRVLHQLSICM